MKCVRSSLFILLLSCLSFHVQASPAVIKKPSGQQKVLRAFEEACLADEGLCPQGLTFLFQEIECGFDETCHLIYTILDPSPDATYVQVTSNCPFLNTNRPSDLLQGGAVRPEILDQFKSCMNDVVKDHRR